METFQFHVNPAPFSGRFLTACLVGAIGALLAGCDSASDTSVDLATPNIEAHLPSAATTAAELAGSPISFKAAEPRETPEMASDSRVVNDAPAPLSVPPGEPDVVPDEPEPEDMDFFNAPTVSVESNQVIEATEDSAPLRLIGFISVPSESGISDKAILKLGEKMLTLGAGEVADGVEILEIKDRSVTIQRDRQRRTLGLFDQPLVNPIVVRKSNKSRNGSQARSTSSRGMSRTIERGRPRVRALPTLPLGPRPASVGVTASGRASTRRGGFDPSELPELPERPGLEMPDLDLPGLDLPGLDLPGLDLP